jgi:hypothetical protein
MRQQTAVHIVTCNHKACNNSHCTFHNDHNQARICKTKKQQPLCQSPKALTSASASSALPATHQSKLDSIDRRLSRTRSTSNLKLLEKIFFKEMKISGHNSGWQALGIYENERTFEDSQMSETLYIWSFDVTSILSNKIRLPIQTKLKILENYERRFWEK